MSAQTLQPQHQHRAVHIVVHVANVMFAVITVLVVVVGAASWLSHDGMFGMFGHKVLVVRSGSMSPTFSTGDAVIVAKVQKTSSVNLGDVITFRNATNPSIIVSHRVVAKWSGSDGVYWFNTKGDANSAADLSPIPESNIIGKVTGAIPRLGYILVGLRSMTVLSLFIASLGLAHLSLHLARSADSLEFVETNHNQEMKGDVS